MRPPRVLLASRYEIATSISGLQSSRCFVGFDTTAGRSVVVRLTVPPQSRWLAASRGATHRYLASVIDVVDNPDAQAFPDSPSFAKGTVAIVAEALRGISLREHLLHSRLGTDRGVAWVIRVAEAVRCLHSRGAAHGAISTRSILVEAGGRAIPPVVTQLVTPQLGAFASPERLTGEGPSVSDDLWAIGVLLHLLVAGELPFRGDSPASLLDTIQDTESRPFASVTGPDLRELESIAMRFLALQRRRRPASIDDVIDALDRWERRSPMSMQPAALGGVDRLTTNRSPKLIEWDELTFDEANIADNFDQLLAAVEEERAASNVRTVSANSALGTDPSTITGYDASRSSRAAQSPGSSHLPSSLGPARRRISSDAFSLRLRKRPRWGVLAVLVALVGAAVGAAVVSLVGNISSAGRSLVKVIQPRNSAPSLPSARTHEHVNPRKERDACVRSYYPTDAFATEPDLEFVCTNENLIEVTQQLNALAILISADANDAGSADAGGAVAIQRQARPANSAELVVTAGSTTRTWQLGWYELLATGIIQRNCCRDPPAIKLPTTSGWCQQLQVVVTNIANQSTKSGDISSAVHAYDEAITCLMSQGRHTVYSYKSIPTAAQKAAFQQFLTHAAETDARRASRKF